ISTPRGYNSFHSRNSYKLVSSAGNCIIVPVRMKKIIVSETWLYRYRFMFGYLVLILSGLFVLFYRLGSLLPGISTLEANTATLGMQLHGIIAVSYTHLTLPTIYSV